MDFAFGCCSLPSIAYAYRRGPVAESQDSLCAQVTESSG